MSDYAITLYYTDIENDWLIEKSLHCKSCDDECCGGDGVTDYYLTKT